MSVTLSSSQHSLQVPNYGLMQRNPAVIKVNTNDIAEKCIARHITLTFDIQLC